MTTETKPKRDRSTKPVDLAKRAQSQLEEIKLGRIGHFCTPRKGEGIACQTAIIADVIGERPLSVNLAVFNQSGFPGQYTSIVVSPPQDGQATFHLNRDCPEGR